MSLNEIFIYLLILVAKCIEVSLGTLRVILSSKGEKNKATFVGMIEITLWVYIASNVLSSINEDPIKGIVYIIGFTMGIYLGGKLDEKLKVGNVRVNAIVSAKDGENLAKRIRENDYAVTVFKGHGMKEAKHLLVMIVNKKRVNTLIKLLKTYEEIIEIDYNDISYNYGAYGVLKK